MGCVYIITNQLNDMQYVGATTETKDQRFARHSSSDIQDYQGSTIQPAIQEYGVENFSIKAIFYSNSWPKLCATEKRSIKKYKTRWPNGYNMTDGGDGRVGVKWTAKQAEMIPAAIKKFWQDPVAKKKAVDKMKKIFLQPKVKKKLRKNARAMWNIPGYRENFSKKSKATWAIPENKKKHQETSRKLWEDPEFRKKMHTPEIRRNMSKGQKRAWKIRKAKINENYSKN